MGRTMRADMYENVSVRKRASGEYEETVYDRRVQATEKRGVAVRREPLYQECRGSGKRNVAQMESGKVSGGSRAVWKEPMYEADRRNREAGAYRTTGQEKTKRGRKKFGRRKRKSAARKVLTGLLFYFLFAGMIATCIAVVSVFSEWKEKRQSQDAAKTDGIMADGTEAWTEEETGSRALMEITPEIRHECQELYEEQEELLLIVNKDHELETSYQPMLRNICKGRLKAADILYEDLCAMLEDGGQAGYEYWIASAHRDRTYQQGLVDEDVKKYMAKGYTYEAALQKTYEYTMPAGQSEHETGLALDILCSTNMMMDESQAYEPGNQWLAAHCHEYGFILRYPADKEDVTGIKYEPWHFRYVGKEAAAYLRNKGWTLEEFYRVIHDSIR
jgi:D-alanyl-D-alanine carboxypeptidase